MFAAFVWGIQSLGRTGLFIHASPPSTVARHQLMCQMYRQEHSVGTSTCGSEAGCFEFNPQFARKLGVSVDGRCAYEGVAMMHKLFVYENQMMTRFAHAVSRGGGGVVPTC